MTKDGILLEEHKVSDLFEKLDEIHTQVKLTNGRVTRLEKRSIGTWIANHPFKFAGFTLIFFVIVISDSRQAIINALLKMFGA